MSHHYLSSNGIEHNEHYMTIVISIDNSLSIKLTSGLISLKNSRVTAYFLLSETPLQY